jgi:ribokinase
MACSAKVEHLPRLGESLSAEAFTLEVGGKGLNLALGAARLGAKVNGILPLGNDLFGRMATNALRGHGLSEAMLLTLTAQTGSGIGFADRNGDNCLAVYPGANGRLSAADVRARAAEIAASGLVVAQFEIPDDPIREAFAIARESGRKTLLTPSPYRDVDPGILADTSIVVLNRVEARRLADRIGAGAAHTGDLSPGHVEDIAAALHDNGVEMVVVTLGADGAVAYRTDGPPIHRAAFAVTAVDTLGAGDAFTAGLAVSLLEGRDLVDCLRRASACAAIVVQNTGVFDVLPRRAQVEAFLASEPAAAHAISADAHHASAVT